MECLRVLQRRPRLPSSGNEAEAVLAYPDMPAPPARVSRHVSLPSGEYAAMAKMVAGLDAGLRSRLVSHRGFHDAEGTTKERPIENTTAAYREAFRAGMPLAECDITLTSDGHLILCHDNTLRRLADDMGDARVDGPVTSLTLAELLAVSLKRAERIALLDDVLGETEAQGARLVIEVKTGADGAKISDALCAYFRKCPQRLACTAVVMSFDFDIITRFAKEFLADVAEARAAGAQLPRDALPKLLLLLRNQKRPRGGRPASSGVYLELDWQASCEQAAQRMDGYMARAESVGAPLDGLYVQMHPRMLREDSGRCAMQKFAQRHVLGVWGGRGDPDDAGTCQQLMELGVHFVNTDLPLDFAEKRERGSSDPLYEERLREEEEEDKEEDSSDSDDDELPAAAAFGGHSS